MKRVKKKFIGLGFKISTLVILMLAVMSSVMVFISYHMYRKECIGNYGSMAVARFMRFEGESFHENIGSFFSEITDWLKAFLKTDFSAFNFECELEYFNSSTAKLLLNMVLDMDEHASDDKKIIIDWITTEDNDIIIECGEDFRDEIENLEFNLIMK